MDPDPTPFFIDFKDAKKIFFKYFFHVTCPQAHHLQSKKFYFLLKFCFNISFCRHYFSLLNTFMRKGKDPDPDPDQDPGCPKIGTLKLDKNIIHVVWLEVPWLP
jgi:hypothetical protein